MAMMERTPNDDIECPTCGGSACEEGCGRCESAWSGPDSHRVCSRCHGAGVIERYEGYHCTICGAESGSTDLCVPCALKVQDQERDWR